MRALRKRYALNQCALFKCGSRKRLFELIQTSEGKYAELAKAENLYKPLVKRKKNGEPRIVYSPRGDLKRIQRRICKLLMRVEPPDFLMSPVRGRSNIDNAASHRFSQAHRLMDLADFYPNCSANKVAEFFTKAMLCPPDVVSVLVKLTTNAGALPQGSPTSPILAYFSYHDMWGDAKEIANRAGNRITVYVDDITVSGMVVSGRTLWQLKRLFWRHGHKTKLSKEESRLMTPVVVTGVVLRDKRLLLPNAQHEKRHRVRSKLEGLPDGPERKLLKAVLRGHNETEKQISKRCCTDSSGN